MSLLMAEGLEPDGLKDPFQSVTFDDSTAMAEKWKGPKERPAGFLLFMC